MNDILKIDFYRISRKHDFGSHMQFTLNCGYHSDDREFSTSKVEIVQIFSLRPGVVVRARSDCRAALAHMALILASINLPNLYRCCSNTSMKTKN